MSCIKIEVWKRRVSWGVEGANPVIGNNIRSVGQRLGEGRRQYIVQIWMIIKGTMEPVCLLVQNNLPDFLHAWP